MSPLAPKMQSHTLQNGLRVRLFPQAHLRSAEVGLYVQAGPRFEAAEDNGLSHFTEHMLFRGTYGYETKALHSKIEEVGGPIMAMTGRDYCLYYLQLPQRHLQSAIPLLADICLKPTFDGMEIERPIILEELLEDQNENGQDINPENHARGLQWPLTSLAQTILGSEDNIKSFTPADLKRHHQRHYCAKNCLLYLSGPDDLQAYLPLLEATFGQMPPGEALTFEQATLSQKGPQGHLVENDASQNALVLAFHAPALRTADHLGMTLLNMALSDGMTSRLQWHLCESLGLVYDLDTIYETYADVASYDISASCAPQKSVQVLKAIFATLADLKAAPLDAKELHKIKERYAIAVELTHDSPGGIANPFSREYLYGLAPDLADTTARAAAYSAAELQALAQRIFTPENLCLIVVGKVDPTLRKGLGDALNGPWT